MCHHLPIALCRRYHCQPRNKSCHHKPSTLLGKNLSPFGSVVTGYGNGDGVLDGAVDGNIFGTYMHGPVLARNPEFADLLLARAVGKSLDPFNDELANRYAQLRRKALD